MIQSRDGGGRERSNRNEPDHKEVNLFTQKYNERYCFNNTLTDAERAKKT
eukprot:TRINITY_DN4180_c0_g1_i1.p2 TRINITY_DN4180_c0_g1~~TRINITY_DN4180_c0_g1_i1.p2  ORF type:complete len:50 (+),score=6.93 TRINITY_DN4180_c0_g1_i1:98-247(+)